MSDHSFFDLIPHLIVKVGLSAILAHIGRHVLNNYEGFSPLTREGCFPGSKLPSLAHDALHEALLFLKSRLHKASSCSGRGQ